MYLYYRLKYILLNSWRRNHKSRGLSIAANGHPYVDLGLSVMWATMNVGANKVYEFGYPYKWGEQTPCECSNRDYTFRGRNGISKYYIYGRKGIPDYKDTLEDVDDAAHQVMGGGWRLPTRREWDELLGKCKFDIVTINDIVDAYHIKGVNGNSIYLPINRGTTSIARSYQEDTCWYWSSSLNAQESDTAFGTTIVNSDEKGTSIHIQPLNRELYCFVRGVINKRKNDDEKYKKRD